MNYPIELLPNVGYKHITADLTGHYLIRYFEQREWPVLNSVGFLTVQYICSPKENISDLSTSLLGVFTPKHIQIRLTECGVERFARYCRPDQNLGVPVFDEDFTVDASRRCWFVAIDKIRDIPVDYSMADEPFHAICKVEHSPMFWNFWHFSIRWQLHDGLLHEKEEKAKAKIAKRLALEARALISRFATLSEPNYSELERDGYISA